MKTKTVLLASHLAIMAIGLISARAQNTAFTYQGVLKTADGPASGLYDFKFRLFDAATAGNRVPNSTTEVSTNAVPVSNGLFNVRLDFGSSAFDGNRRWLEMDVRTNNPSLSYVLLSPRTELTPTPYAIRAHSAATVPDNSITASKISPGQVVKSLNGLKDNVNLVAGANVTLTSSGNNLSVSASSGPFSLNGASAYYNGGSVGIGTSTPQAKLHVAGGDILAGPAGQEWIIHTRYATGGDFLHITDMENGVPQWQRGLTLTQNGKVGIGTSSPAGGLQVASGGMAVTGQSSPFVGAGQGVFMESGWNGGNVFAYDYNQWTPRALTLNAPGGNVGIGTHTPEEKLHVAGGNLLVEGWGGEMAYLGGDGWGGDMQVGSYNPAIDTISAYNQASQKWMNLTVKSLTILGGADLAEPFEMSHKDIPQGAVVVIDEAHPGQLRMSDRAYDTHVAGVVSGANGIKPGISLTQEGAFKAGENVALTGRVYVQADASEHPIKPGDLLTTSGVPGHAMKAADSSKISGAVIGKAMTSLNEGKGLVLVLVSLQ